jgi:hypothetical protein
MLFNRQTSGLSVFYAVNRDLTSDVLSQEKRPHVASIGLYFSESVKISLTIEIVRASFFFLLSSGLQIAIVNRDCIVAC